jgi:hypothetical protein
MAFGGKNSWLGFSLLANLELEEARDLYCGDVVLLGMQIELKGNLLLI